MAHPQKTLQNDLVTKALIDAGRLRVEPQTGLVYATESKTPGKPIGAPNKRGYLRTCITTRGKAISLMMHRVNHKDGRKANNALSNLELATPAANNEHARQTGLWKPVSGIDNGFAKLTDDQIREARAMKARGSTPMCVAVHLGITPSYARRILRGKARNACPG